MWEVSRRERTGDGETGGSLNRDRKKGQPRMHADEELFRIVRGLTQGSKHRKLANDDLRGSKAGWIGRTVSGGKFLAEGGCVLCPRLSALGCTSIYEGSFGRSRFSSEQRP